LICTDIDGTLLNKKRELSNFTIKEIKRVKNKVPVILISSRMPSAMIHLQRKLEIENEPLICYNGTLIIDNKRTIYSDEINHDVVAEIVNLKKNIPFHVSLYHYDNWYVEEYDYWAKREENNTKVTPTVTSLKGVVKNWEKNKNSAHKIMCMGNEEYISDVQKQLDKDFGKEITMYRSKPTYLEITTIRCSKLTALIKLIEYKYTPINLDNVIAFGDNYNDIDLLAGVKIGVAVANAKPEALAVANYITSSNRNDGVAKAIKKYFR